MGGGKKNPYRGFRTLVSDPGISGRASVDLMQETKAAMAEYLAVYEAARELGEKSALEKYMYGEGRDLSELVLDLERRLQSPLDALHNRHRDLQSCKSKSRKAEEHQGNILRVAKAAKL
eukprot:2638296-Prorocentrum_lima.AAC.1